MGWGMQMVVPKDFCAYGVESHTIMACAANMLCNLIRTRVARGIGANDAPMPAYKRRRRLLRDANGQIVRDARGRWTEIEVRSPGDVVNLRSPDPSIPAGKHMIENITFSPRYPTASDRVVWVGPQGSRVRETVGKDGVVRRESIRHADRAIWCQRGGKKDRPDRNVQPRPFLGISESDHRAIFQALQSVPPIGWLDTHSKQSVDAYLRRAIAARKSLMKAKLEQNEARMRSSERTYAKMMAALGPDWSDEKIADAAANRPKRSRARRGKA